MKEEQVIEQLQKYKRIVARMHVLENYSIGAGITVSRLNQDDQLMELHRRLRGMPSYMYLSRREQELETTAHAYLSGYPSGIRAQLAALPSTAADPEDEKALKELRRKIEKIIEARTGGRDPEGYDEVIERISEFQDLQIERMTIESTLEALAICEPEYARVLRLRFVEGRPANEVAQEANITERTLRRWQKQAVIEYVRILSA